MITPTVSVVHQPKNSIIVLPSFGFICLKLDKEKQYMKSLVSYGTNSTLLHVYKKSQNSLLHIHVLEE